VPIEQLAGRAPEPVWTLWKGSAGNRTPNPQSLSPVAWSLSCGHASIRIQIVPVCYVLSSSCLFNCVLSAVVYVQAFLSFSTCCVSPHMLRRVFLQHTRNTDRWSHWVRVSSVSVFIYHLDFELMRTSSRLD